MFLPPRGAGWLSLTGTEIFLEKENFMSFFGNFSKKRIRKHRDSYMKTLFKNEEEELERVLSKNEVKGDSREEIVLMFHRFTANLFDNIGFPFCIAFQATFAIYRFKNYIPYIIDLRKKSLKPFPSKDFVSCTMRFSERVQTDFFRGSILFVMPIVFLIQIFSTFLSSYLFLFFVMMLAGLLASYVSMGISTEIAIKETLIEFFED